MTYLLPAFVGMPEVNRVYCMDALALLRAMPDSSVDLVLTDPPYGHNNNNGDLIERIDTFREKEYIPGAKTNPRPIANDGPEANALFRACLVEYRRILKLGACCCCCCGGGGPDPQVARWSLWMDEVLEFKQMIVWDKGPIGMGWHYRRSYETILVAMKPGAACKWYDTSNQIENIIRPADGLRKIIPTIDDHPTPKPVLLMEHFIKLHTAPGDLVVDPFTGGGPVPVAARNLGRRFIAGDTDAGYCEIARRRLAQPYTPNMFDTLLVNEATS